MSRARKLVAMLAGAMALAAPFAAAKADPIADFYAGKRINFTVVIGAGGTYGLYSRLVAEHLPRHLPGNPGIVVSHMTGAGGVKGTNYLYNVAPKDGSHIGMVFKDIVLVQMLRPKEVRYDARQFNWIGSVNEYVAILMVWHTAGIKTLEDAKKKEIVVGSSGRNNHGYMLAAVMNDLLGTKFKIISGYRGAADMHLAMETGEAHSRIGSWESIKSGQAAWIREKKIAMPVQAGLNRAPDLPDMPLFLDMVAPADRPIVEMIDSGSVIGWSVSTPPGVPADRVAALRRAFDATVKDPEFVASARKMNVDLNTKPGSAVQAVIERVMSADESLVLRLRKILEVEG